jgi:hypothetical protein
MVTSAVKVHLVPDALAHRTNAFNKPYSRRTP